MAPAHERNQRPAKNELRKQIQELQARLALQDEALRAGEHRLRLALEAGRMGTWEWIISSGKVIWSPALEVIHGRTPGGFAGTFQAVLEEVHPDDRAAVAETIERTLRERTDYHIEYRIVLPDGSLRWVEGRGLVFCDESGAPERMLGVCSDITERKRSEEAILQNLKLESLSVLAAGMAHDFNNLLTSVIGNASLLLDLGARESPDRELLAGIVQSGERAAELTRQLLAYAGKGMLFKKTVDVSELLRDMRAVLLPLIPSTIQLHLDLPQDLPAIHADPAQLEQVVRSLVMNAVEAVGDGQAGSVFVRTGVHEGEEECVFLEVRDTGVGMDEATKARIFDPFFTTKFLGRGLGLSAVQGIVRAHHGSMIVESSPGEGSTFRLLLRIAGQQAPGARKDICKEGHTAGAVLVVDDEWLVRQTAINTLQRHGYKVVSAVNGLDALEVFRRHQQWISLVLLDLSMPVMSGEEALEKLKSMRPDLPVLLSSGYSEAEALRRFRAQALAGFLQKPYTSARLVAKVRSVLGEVKAAEAHG